MKCSLLAKIESRELQMKPIKHSPSIAEGRAIRSMNAGLRAFRRRLQTPPSRFFSPA
jgi:hypothetical protein